MRKGGLGQYGREQVAAATGDMPRYLRTPEERRLAKLTPPPNAHREPTLQPVRREG